LSWWGIIPTLAFFVVEAVFGWPAARAERANVTDAISAFVGQIAAGVIIPALIAWIVYRFAGRSPFFSTFLNDCVRSHDRFDVCVGHSRIGDAGGEHGGRADAAFGRRFSV
jgi:hypothetical protein